MLLCVLEELEDVLAGENASLGDDECRRMRARGKRRTGTTSRTPMAVVGVAVCAWRTERRRESEGGEREADGIGIDLDERTTPGVCRCVHPSRSA